MPDLRSELEKVIHAWEQPEQPESQPTHETIMTTPTTTPTSNLNSSERLFNFVKANPGLTALQIEARVPDVAPTSLSSLLAQMAKRHLLVKSGGSGPNHYGGVFHAAVDKYMSPAEQLGVGRNRRMSNSVKAKAKVKVKKQSKQMDMFTLDTSVRKAPRAPAPQPELTVSSPAPQMRSVFDLDVESLTIAEARALRDKLNALFGG